MIRRVTGFGPEHLPYGVFRRAGEAPRVGARLGDGVLDLAALAADGPLDEDPALFDAAVAQRVHGGRARDVGARARGAAVAHRGARRRARDGRARRGRAAAADRGRRLRRLLLVARARRERRAGSSGPTPTRCVPNWRHMPIGYHGRAGTVVVSGTPIRRPSGQRREPGDDAPVFGPSVRLDIELELGFVVGVPSALGEPVAVDARARPRLRRAAGQRLERARPAGVGVPPARAVPGQVVRDLGRRVGHAARRGARTAASPRRRRSPRRCAYLREEPWALDLDLEIELNGTVVARTNARHLYWSAAQQLAHLTVNGASLRVGDLFASGTISGPEREQRGCLLELSWNGAEPIELADGSTRSFLEDGDEVVLRGRGGDARRARRGPRADRAGGLMALPKAIRRLAPDRLRDDVRLRSVFVGAGLIPPRTMHSEDDAAVLRATAAGRRRVVELGVYEGSSAVVLCEVLDAGAELHLVDPFGHHGWALPAGGGRPRARAAASSPAPRAATPARA